MKLVLFIALLSLPFVSMAQHGKKKKNSHGQGTLYGYWGYNRTAYTKSNIRFIGPGYDFTLAGSEAHDNPAPLDANYLRIDQLSIPQFNVRIGYYIRNHWALSIGYDHFKYLFKDGNEVRISGTIDPGVDEVTNWEGTYSSQLVTTNRKQFHYENSDGLNYLRLGLMRTDMLYAAGNRNQFAVSSMLGVGAGALLSYNDFDFAGQKDVRTISLSGYGISAHAGIRLEFFRHFFVQTSVSAGVHHQIKVRTRPLDPSSFARHAYGYSEFNTVVGFLLYIRPTNACDSCPVW